MGAAAQKGASRCSGCVTGHPSPPDAFALATMIAFGGPGRPASAAAHPYAVYHSSHNDLTPLRGYRGLIGFALLSMPPRKEKKDIPERTLWYRITQIGYSNKSSRRYPYKGDKEKQEAFKKGALRK